MNGIWDWNRAFISSRMGEDAGSWTNVMGLRLELRLVHHLDQQALELK